MIGLKLASPLAADRWFLIFSAAGLQIRPNAEAGFQIRPNAKIREVNY